MGCLGLFHPSTASRQGQEESVVVGRLRLGLQRGVFGTASHSSLLQARDLVDLGRIVDFRGGQSLPQ